MKKMFQDVRVKFVGIVTALAAVILPAVSHAQFATTTAVTETTTFIGQLALVIAGVVTAILGLLAALVGLGWGVRKFLKWVGGRKF